jgi:hypothetical protein
MLCHLRKDNLAHLCAQLHDLWVVYAPASDAWSFAGVRYEIHEVFELLLALGTSLNIKRYVVVVVAVKNHVDKPTVEIRHVKPKPLHGVDLGGALKPLSIQRSLIP